MELRQRNNNNPNFYSWKLYTWLCLRVIQLGAQILSAKLSCQTPTPNAPNLLTLESTVNNNLVPCRGQIALGWYQKTSSDKKDFHAFFSALAVIQNSGIVFKKFDMELVYLNSSSITKIQLIATLRKLFSLVILNIHIYNLNIVSSLKMRGQLKLLWWVAATKKWPPILSMLNLNITSI